jgi:poly-gamma-glutamate capsule biosynthesis protein CapA/YwtB (metallophosphatase superfamily)
VKLALAGDTMLGRGVAQALIAGEQELLAPEVVAAASEADLFLVNLECCISARGERWPDPGKPFFFRAPPRAAELLAAAGVDCVSLANNHALDFGERALLDTFEHLAAFGIHWVGAGGELAAARAPVRLSGAGEQLSVVAFSDHPAEFAAAAARPGIAFADLRGEVPEWLLDTVAHAERPVVVSAHWGPNMTSEPLHYVRRAAGRLRDAGAALIAGHSAHVFHGAGRGVLFDLGDFLDDYMVDPSLRNDLGLLCLVTLEGGRTEKLEALPLKLEYCHTRLAREADAAWVRQRFRAACEALGTEVLEADGRVVVELEQG